MTGIVPARGILLGGGCLLLSLALPPLQAAPSMGPGGEASAGARTLEGPRADRVASSSRSAPERDRPSREGRPRRLLTGSFPARELPGEEPRLRGGGPAELASLLPKLLPETFQPIGGEEGQRAEIHARLSRDLARLTSGAEGETRGEGGPESEPGWWLLVSPPMARLVDYRERFRRLPTRLELDVEWVAGEPEEGEGAEPRRWFSLWILPRTEPVLLGRLRQVLPGGRERRARYLGPWNGWERPDRGWTDLRRNEIRRAPVRPLPPELLAPAGVAEVRPEPPGRPVPSKVVERGRSSGAILKPLRLVIRSQRSLRREWARLHAGQVPEPALPAFSPGRETLILISLGRGQGKDLEVVVDGVRELGDGNLEVHWGRRPSTRSGGTSGLDALLPASPYLLLRVPRPANRRFRILGR